MSFQLLLASSHQPGVDFALNMLDAKPLALSVRARSALSVDDLEYEAAEPLRGARLVLHAGKVTYLIVAAHTLCGNAGCPFLLVDSASHTRIGEFLGRRVEVLRQRINGWPVLELDGRERVEFRIGRYERIHIQ